MTVELFLKFPDRETMLEVASLLSGIPDIEHPSVDGWLILDPETNESHYWNLCEIGTLSQETGAVAQGPNGPVPVFQALEGYHVNGLWHGPAESLPAALVGFRIFPETPQVRFG